MAADCTKTNRNTRAHFSLWTEAGKQQCHMGTAEVGKENSEHAWRGQQRNTQHPAKTRKAPSTKYVLTKVSFYY